MKERQEVPVRFVPARLAAPLLLLWVLPARSQVNTGELRLRVQDPASHGLRASVTLSSEANHYRGAFTTNDDGEVEIKTLAYGIYLVRADSAGFAVASRTVEIRSELPVEHTMRLALSAVTSVVQVNGAEGLIDPNRPSSVMEIGAAQIQDRVGSLPGRSVQDLVDSEPGWLYEGNAVLHPRGSEYQTQFVIDGIPLTDNRSPSFGPEIEADDLDSAAIYTAGIPAEYGRKMGGIVELNTRRETAKGLHGEVVLSGGSYDTAGGYARVQDVWGKNSAGASASGSMSAHYLNPVVPENYTNRGTTGDFSVHFDRDFTPSDRLSLGVRHELSRFEIPNETLQEQAGQLQTGDNFETMGTARYQHVFSAESLFTLAGMVRDTANGLDSNANSTPIIAAQRNEFREGYFKAAYTLHDRNQEFKAGAESDAAFLHEHFAYTITDPSQFDDGTPLTLAPFKATDLDFEPSLFVEDQVRLGRWTVTAGLRWDHYQLLTNQSAFSPRVSVGRSVPSLNMVLHASLDRVFQTPSFENILITSSAWVNQLDPSVVHLPVKPSVGTYYEGGLTQAFKSHLTLDANVYRRDVRNYADDDQLLNTGVSYPIAFDKAIIYGAEAKLTLVRVGGLSGYASYSYMLGNAWFPVTGGVFLGDDAVDALNQTRGHFPDSQDQRNTLQTRFRYQIGPRLWVAAGANYGSGLPFEYEGDEADALAEYGPAVISRINFERGRVLPALSANATCGVDLYKGDQLTTRFQVDGENLNNRLNVIDFGGLFSGNAIGPGRNIALRLSASF
jgi:hypothetical protein